MAKNDPTGGGMGYFPAVYQSALAQTAQDYDSIMGQYKGLTDSARSSSSSSSSGSGSNQVNFNPINPVTAEYQPGSDYKYLRDFTEDGGYSGEDVNNLRERAISPIRSIYDSASRNMNRQKNLSGGYSPNAGAVNAKLARESSYLMGDQLTKANAGIAEMVQRGKLAGATALAPLEARENELKNSITQNNANTQNDFLKFNATAPLSFAEFNSKEDDNSFEKILAGIQGQQSLYGTNPAIASTFGNQALQAANTVNNFAPVTRAAAIPPAVKRKPPIGSGGPGMSLIGGY